MSQVENLYDRFSIDLTILGHTSVYCRYSLWSVLWLRSSSSSEHTSLSEFVFVGCWRLAARQQWSVLAELWLGPP